VRKLATREIYMQRGQWIKVREAMRAGDIVAVLELDNRSLDES
jgi:hypothetical protein